MSLLSWLKSRVRTKQTADLQAGGSCVVTVSDEQVSCTRPNGKVETIAWDELRFVLIETTDEGPFATDVFWVLAGNDSGCVVPMGAAGEDELISKLQALPNFDNQAFLEAMSSTTNRRFVCWKRSTAS